VTPLFGIDISSLSLWRGERMLFRDLDLSLRAGEALTLEGPNGVGKTSLLRALAGFLEPRAGAIVLTSAGGQRFESAEERAPFVGWLGHHDGSKPQMTPREVLGFFRSFAGGSGDIEDMLAQAGIARVGDLPVQYLSAGQKRRLALARLSLSARPMWLLDEPLASLDTAGKSFVSALVCGHCRAGGIVVAATHEALGLEALGSACTRLALGR